MKITHTNMQYYFIFSQDVYINELILQILFCNLLLDFTLYLGNILCKYIEIYFHYKVHNVKFNHLKNQYSIVSEIKMHVKPTHHCSILKYYQHPSPPTKRKEVFFTIYSENLVDAYFPLVVSCDLMPSISTSLHIISNP